MRTVEITKNWFSKNNTQRSTSTHVVLSNKKFHVCWNLFNYGYRRFGIAYYKHGKALCFYFGTGCFSISVKS